MIARRLGPAALVLLGVLAACGSPQTVPDPTERDRGDLESQLLLSPEDPYWPWAIGVQAMDADSAEVAEIWFKSSLQVEPLYAPALSHLTALQYQQGRHEDALALLNAAEASWSGVFPRTLMAGKALHQQALGSQAEAENTAATADVDAVSSFVYLKGDRFRLAQFPAKVAHEIDSRNPTVLNNMAITLLQQGNARGARDMLREATVLAPELPGPLYNLAAVECFYFRDMEEAQVWMDRYLMLDQQDPDGIAEAIARAGGEKP